MAEARGELGREYDNRIGSDPAHHRTRSDKKFQSINPSRPSEVVGIHRENTAAAAAREAIAAATLMFETWRFSDPRQRVHILLPAAALLRQRKPY